MISKTNVSQFSVLIILLLFFTKTVEGQGRSILLEKATATWCGPCVAGMVYGDSLVASDKRIIVVSVNQNDSLAVDEYFNNSNFPGFPMARINRYSEYYLVEDWFEKVDSVLQLPPMATVDMELVYNESNRVLSIDVKTEFFKDTVGDYRISVILLEDGIIGESNALGQTNGYADGIYGPMGGYESLPLYIDGGQIMHNKVAREIIGGYHGIQSSLPTNIIADQEYSYVVRDTLSLNFNHNNVRVVALLVNGSDGTVLSAAQSDYLDGSSNRHPVILSKPNTEMAYMTKYEYQLRAQDPNDFKLTYNIFEAPEWLSLSQDGYGNGRLSGIAMDTGVFEVIVEVSDGELTDLQTFDLSVRSGDGMYWQPLGSDEGTPFQSYASKGGNWNRFITSTAQIAIDKENNTFAAFIEDTSDKVYVNYLNQSEEWKSTGFNANTLARESKIRLRASNGKAYLLYSVQDSLIRLKLAIIDTNTIEDILVPISTQGRPMDLHIANGKVYILSISGLAYQVIVKNEDGSWSELNDSIQQLDSDTSGFLYAHFGGSIRKYDGLHWVKHTSALPTAVDSTPVRISRMAVEIPDHIYVTTIDATGSIRAFEWSLGQWKEITGRLADLKTYQLDLIVNKENEPIILIDNQHSGGGAYCSKWSQNQWIDIGSRPFSDKPIGKPNLAVQEDGTLVASYIEGYQAYKQRIVKYARSDLYIDLNQPESTELVFYPNPIEGNRIQFNQTLQEAPYRLVSLNGQVVQEGVVRQSDFLTLSNLSKGVFILRIKDNSHRIIVK